MEAVVDLAGMAMIGKIMNHKLRWEGKEES